MIDKCQKDIFCCVNTFLCGDNWINPYNNFAFREPIIDKRSYSTKFVIWLWDKWFQNRMTKASECCMDDYHILIFECCIVKIW